MKTVKMENDIYVSFATAYQAAKVYGKCLVTMERSSYL